MKTKTKHQPLFALGTLVSTMGALGAVPALEILAAVGRHVRGDWGELSEHDKQRNDESLSDGERILSVYRTLGGIKFYVITEADRSSTCVLLPDEY